VNAIYAVESDGSQLPGEFRFVRISALHIASPTETLTLREHEILVYIAAGVAYETAAEALSITERTFRSHAHVINQKLRCRNNVQTAAYAIAARLVSWEEIEQVWRVYALHLLKPEMD
jgi:two-component system, NarL family, nitrate/nitrite response regulator NarL